MHIYVIIITTFYTLVVVSLLLPVSCLLAGNYSQSCIAERGLSTMGLHARWLSRYCYRCISLRFRLSRSSII